MDTRIEKISLDLLEERRVRSPLLQREISLLATYWSESTLSS